MTETISDTIQQNAQGPKRAKGDNTEMEQHSLPDQIAAEKFLAAKQAMKNPSQGFTRVKIVPPGT